MIVAWSYAIYLNYFHEYAAQLEFLATLKIKSIGLLLGLGAAAVLGATTCRRMHDTGGIVASLRATGTASGSVDARVVAVGISFGAKVPNVRRRVRLRYTIVI